MGERRRQWPPQPHRLRRSRIDGASAGSRPGVLANGPVPQHIIIDDQKLGVIPEMN
jgi:hypothetical protein